MYLKFFPAYSSNGSHTFSNDEVQKIVNLFATFNFSSDEIFGPYELLNFTLHGPYATVLIFPSKGGVSKVTLTGIMLGSVFGAIGILLLILLVYWKRCHRNQDRDLKDQLFPKIPIKIEGVKAFSFKEMELATSNFSITNQIGQGGYGKVYKGISADGTVVAIKRAQQGSLQGENEFYTEMELLSRLHHRNLVSLVGYCDEKSEQMLVYEFMPRGSVHDLLSAGYTDIKFGTRLQIALGAARGILYLHTEADPPIIHRDIKATNILLDSKYNAKVSDFGISKVAPLPDEKGNTPSHVSTVVKGTPGYVDPEYFLTHQLTEKSDVYSLGIVFLELLTGMQPISHGRNIVREVNAACESGTMFSIIDRNMGPCSTDSIKKFMALALRCSRDETEDRPSVLEVVKELENIVSLLPEVYRKNKTEEAFVSFASNSTPSTRSSPWKNPNHVSMDFLGSDLISGVVSSIGPR